MPGLRSTCSCALAALLLAACGGGGGGGAGQSAPVALGAALPDGNHIVFAATEVNLSEANRRVEIEVVRTGAGIGEARVQYRTVAGTAQAGADYTSLAGELVWADGEAGVQSIELVVASDLEDEPVEALSVELHDLVGSDTFAAATTLPVSLRSSDCDAGYSTRINSDTRWSSPCYHLRDQVRVGGSAQLTIDPGTTVFADAGTSLAIDSSATLASLGTPTLPVRLAGALSLPGYWQGIQVLSSNPMQQISHTSISDSNIALDIVSGGGLGVFENNRIDNTALAAMRLPLNLTSSVGDGNQYERSAGGIRLLDSRIDESSTVVVTGQPVHYVADQSLIIDGPLVLEAGVELRVSRESRLYISNRGSLNAVGTADQPIRIIGEEAEPGFWSGIQWVSSTSDQNVLDHVEVAHAGGDAARAGNIIIDGSGTQLTVRNSHMADSDGYGILLISSGAQLSFADNSFANNRLGDLSE